MDSGVGASCSDGWRESRRCGSNRGILRSWKEELEAATRSAKNVRIYYMAGIVGTKKGIATPVCVPIESRVAALENRLDSMWEQAKSFTMKSKQAKSKTATVYSSGASGSMEGNSGDMAISGEPLFPKSGQKKSSGEKNASATVYSGASAPLSGGRATRRAKRSGKKAKKTRSRR